MNDTLSPWFHKPPAAHHQSIKKTLQIENNDLQVQKYNKNEGRNLFPPLWVCSPAKWQTWRSCIWGTLMFLLLFHFFDLKNLSHWGLNQSMRFTWPLCTLVRIYHILFCRYFLTIHFHFILKSTDIIMEQTLAGEIASKPPLISRLRN